ncbi:hypothetical protein HV819_06455 [Anaerococcus sp. AGMB00486]|uniref:Uncharacterized protein n=1 Tax=Anaerococcus faecalis TaxID=2742993 RepID=A0ABX2NA99_9FIRM|nr:hypothetical protein [Anaerococcus faecalis]NVF11626.1 hypothetical protein [Anaerococcus faecalis]
MTTFERDYKDAKEGNGVEVLKRRKQEINDLEEKLRETRNNFRAQCIWQELVKLKAEYNKIDDLF